MSVEINISSFKNLYFIGIGGIGMSALARYFSANGKKVAGYDRVSTKLTADLENSGIQIHYNEAVESIPTPYLDKENTLVVYTPAIPESHKELIYFMEQGFVVKKRAEVLGLITKETYCFAVAGTHGKTTTSTILGYILKETGVQATAFLGGIASNYNSNLILGSDEISVVEADEYDRSFLQLSPNMACITSMDADHLDIYEQPDALTESFKEFATKVSDTLFVRYGLPIEGITYGFDEKADYQAKNIRVKNGRSVFDVKTPSEYLKEVQITLPGKHNTLNTLAAMAMANEYGVLLEKIKQSLTNFKGIERRFNIKIETDNLVLIDDYAHHPTEIDSVFNTVKQLYPDKEQQVIFQPHLYSRTKDFANDFAKSLAQFDSVILLEIYPARELPIQGVTSSWLVEKVKRINANVQLISSLENYDFESLQNTVISMLGAGDIGKMVTDVCNRLNLKTV